MKRNTTRVFLSLLFTCCAFLSLITISCNNKDKSSPFLDKCASIACAYGGRCDQGKCICPTGYDGNNCEIIGRDKFLGTWNVVEKGTITIARSYPIAIERDEAVNMVQIKNMYNYFSLPVRATILKDTIYIANQQLNGKIVFGKGYIISDPGVPANGRISLAYEIIDSANNNIVDDFGVYPEIYHGKASDWTKQ